MANTYPKKSPWLLFLPLNFEAVLKIDFEKYQQNLNFTPE